MKQVQEEKLRNPGMFVSAWEEDDIGIEKDEDGGVIIGS